jgi:hypothetical protein
VFLTAVTTSASFGIALTPISPKGVAKWMTDSQMKNAMPATSPLRNIRFMDSLEVGVRRTLYNTTTEFVLMNLNPDGTRGLLQLRLVHWLLSADRTRNLYLGFAQKLSSLAA